MIQITKMVETCGGCPSQWDGWTEDEKYYYFRFRWGYLRVDAHDADGRSSTIYGKQIGDEYDGIMSYAALQEHIREIMNLPINETYEDRHA